MTEEPPDRRPAGAGRADRAAPLRFDEDEPPEKKVAPWKDWTAVTLRPSRGGKYPFEVSGFDDEKNTRYSKLITSAAHKYFKLEKPPPQNEGPAAYLVEALAADKRSPAVELLRVVYKELIVQFKPDVGWAERNAILEESEFRTVGRSCFAKNQWIVRHVRPEVAGELLLAAADKFERFEQVEFAWPNSVAEYRRSSDPIPKTHRWWLDKIGVNSPPGERSLDEGKASVVIAVLDDGVDIDHPNLVSRVAAGLGRDFNFPPSEPDHSDPRPKKKEETDDDSDWHGTACAGLICSDGNQMGFLGVAPGCRLVAVRVFDGAGLISELEMVANAITYATGVADVISCSWFGPKHEAVVKAINGMSAGRSGKGSVLVCSAGNKGRSTVDFPASHRRAIAVGACGPNNEVTDYANTGDKLDVVTPSSLHNTTVFSTDVSKPGWGFSAGLFSNDVGKTSAAAATAAGVAALCLSANPNLTAAEVRKVLRKTAEKIGKDDPGVLDLDGNPIKYNNAGRSQHFGYGCIKAADAVATANAMLLMP